MIAIVMGLVTTLLFYQYTKKINVDKTETAKTVKVVVAKEKIAMNETITAKKLEVVQMPEKAVLPQSVKSITEAEGKGAAAVIEKGEPILSHRLITASEENIYVSRKVREGYRAVSVGVNFTQSVSNLIEPEDLVDVVCTKGDQNNQASLVSTILFEKVRVLAVGRKMVTPEQPKGKYAEYSSVTLELQPQDAVQLINATQQGKINLILNKRPAMDGKTKQK
jgi:pilus assembly protein CpaB